MLNMLKGILCMSQNLLLNTLYHILDAESRAITPENPTGEKNSGGKATEGVASYASRELGQGWKVSPYIRIPAGETVVLADVKGEGMINHIWLTPTGNWRFQILRFYWEDESYPSVEVPLGDFFCMGWCEYSQLSSLAICVNPGRAFNSYWQMPFKKSFKITLENLDFEEVVLYYQIDFVLKEMPNNVAYFHAQWRRKNPLSYKEIFTILDGVMRKGQYVGTYLAWQVNSNGWWGEGEVKFYIDGDEWPTICGTGTEDYFCGSYNFEVGGKYQSFCTPYSGLHQIIQPDGLYKSQQRFGLYRWHILDPIHFSKDLKVTVQALGWRSGGRYYPRQDDIASVAYWYQTEPHSPFPPLPDRDYLEVV